jgi:hypothetical protein
VYIDSFFIKNNYISGIPQYMRGLTIVLFFLVSTGIHAQDSSVIFIPAGQSFLDVATRDKIYLLPNFTSGKVYFRDGSITSANFNYNFLNGEIEFISASGDTLAIIKEQALNIKNIVIDTNRFYYYNGYLQEMGSNETGKILRRQYYKVKKREKIGAYEQPSSTSAIESYSTFVSGSGELPQKLTVRENITLVKTTEYFLGDQYNTFLRANKKNFLGLYPKKKAQIESYLLKNKVDFNKGEDLQKLLDFLQLRGAK